MRRLLDLVLYDASNTYRVLNKPDLYSYCDFIFLINFDHVHVVLYFLLHACR